MNLSDNVLLNYLVAFFSGVFISFSPCIYPLLPITAGIIGGVNSKGSRIKAFIASLIYVFGVAVTYSFLGVFASLTGKVFGQVQNHPVVFLIVGNMFIIFALVLFDVIPMPSFGGQLQGKVKVRNLWSVLILGMASGLVVGPCTAPILGTLLLSVGLRQNIFYGASLLFVFSYGLGASLIIVGTFSGIIANLPKSGNWLIWVKRVCGIILLAAGEYYLVRAGQLLF